MARDRKAAREALKNRVRQNVKEKKKERAGGSSTIKLPDGMEFMEIKKGTYNLDFLPYEVTANNHPRAAAGEEWYERTYYRHSNIGVAKQNVICPAKTFKKKCPICDYRNTLMENWDQNKKQIDALRPSERQIFNVINLDKESEGVRILDISTFCFGQALDKELDAGEDDWSAFFCIDEGYTVKARFDESSFDGNAFPKIERIDFIERDDYDEKILDEVADLDACINVLSYDELEKMFLEIDDDDEPAEKEKPSTRRTSRDNVPEKEEEELPKETSSRRSRSTQEEEPAPTSSRRSKSSEPEKEEKPVETSGRRSRRSEPEPEPEKEAGEDSDCPGKGTFGKDCDKLDFCNDCEKWEDCKDENDRMNASGRRKRS